MNIKDFFTADIYEYDNKRFRLYNEFPSEREFRESVYLDGTEYPGRLLSVRDDGVYPYWQVEIPDSTGAYYTLRLKTFTAVNSLGQTAPLLDDDAEDTLIAVPYITEGYFHGYYIIDESNNTGEVYYQWISSCGTFGHIDPSRVQGPVATQPVEYIRTGEYPEKFWLDDSNYLEVYFDYYRNSNYPSAEPLPAYNKYTVVYHEEDIQQVEVHKQGSCFDAYTVRAIQSGNVRRISSYDYIERNIPYELHGPVETITEDDETLYKQYYYVKYIDPETEETVWHNTGRFALLKDDREYGEIIPDEQPDEYDRFFIRKIGSTYNAVRYRSTDFSSDREADDYINSTGRYDKFILVRLEPYLSSTLETLADGSKVYYYYVDYLDRSYRCDEYEVYEQGGGGTPEPEPDEIDPDDPNLPDVPEDPNAPYTVQPLGNYEIFQSGSDYYAGRWNYKVYYNGAVEKLDSFSAVSEALTPQLSSTYTDYPDATPRYKRYYYEVHWDDAEKDVHLSRTLETYLDVQYFRARFYDSDGSYLAYSYADAGQVPPVPSEVPLAKYYDYSDYPRAGFDPELSALYEDTDFTAYYADSQGNTYYTARFYKEDDTTLVTSLQKRVMAPFGTLPTAPERRVEWEGTGAYAGKVHGVVCRFKMWLALDGWFELTPSTIMARAYDFGARYYGSSEENPYEYEYYTIVFKDFRGNDIDVICNTGEVPTAPAVPARIYSGNDEYEFKGWSPSTIAPVTGFATYTSVYDKIAKPQVVIRFLDYAGSVLSIQQVEYGTTATAPLVPSYTSPSSGDLNTRFNRYDFTAWNPALASRETESHDYTAQYTATRVYRVRFFDFSDEVIQSQFLEAGATVTAPSVPGTVVSDERTYEFSAWSPSVASVSSNVDYRAIYEEVYYRIRFFDFYGNILSMQNLYRGENPTVPQVEQTIVQNNNVYAFTEWNPAVSAVTGEVDYQPVYEQQTYNVTIRFINSVTNEVIDTQVIPAGTAVTAPQVQDFDVEPSENSGVYNHYAFTGWQPSIASAETQSHDYSAQFSNSQSVKIEFWRKLTGHPEYEALIKTEFVPYGGTATSPATAEPYVIQNGTTVGGEPLYYRYYYDPETAVWDPPLYETETTSHVYKTEFGNHMPVFLIKFYGYGNQLISEDFIESGTELFAPTVPQTVTDGNDTYEFYQWTPAVPSTATANGTYTADYRKQEDAYDWGSNVLSIDFAYLYRNYYRAAVPKAEGIDYDGHIFDEIQSFNAYSGSTVGNPYLVLDGRIACIWRRAGAAQNTGEFYLAIQGYWANSSLRNDTTYMAINVNTGNRIYMYTYASSGSATEVIKIANDSAREFNGTAIASGTQIYKDATAGAYLVEASQNGFILFELTNAKFTQIIIYPLGTYPQ